jgi:D-alanyl-D-alanine dipeptidase
LTDIELSVETQKYVSLPSLYATRPSRHNTGGSVDLAIVEVPEKILSSLPNQPEDMRDLMLFQHARLLDFGTPFDFGGQEAALTYYERLELSRPLTEVERTAQFNRRLLYRVMVEAGMQPYGEEWWHYNAADSQMGARADNRTKAVFGAMNLSDAELRHEQYRQADLTRRNMAFLDGELPFNPRLTTIGRAAIIAPEIHQVETNQVSV